MKKQAYTNDNTEVKELTFIEALKQGLVDYDAVDDYIDKWHDGQYDCEIYEFLGMTRQQYFKWGEDESYLKRTFRKGRKRSVRPQQNTNKTNNRKTAAQ